MFNNFSAILSAARKGINPFEAMGEVKLIQELDRTSNDTSMINKQKRLMLLTALFNRAQTTNDLDGIARWGIRLLPLTVELAPTQGVSRRIALDTMTACYLRKQFSEAYDCAKIALSQVTSVGPEARNDELKGHYMAAKALTKLGNYPVACDYYRQAEEIAAGYADKETGFPLLLASLISISQVYLLNHKPENASETIGRMGEALQAAPDTLAPVGYRWSYWGMRALLSQMRSLNLDAITAYHAGLSLSVQFDPLKDLNTLIGRFGFGIYAYITRDYSTAARWLTGYLREFAQGDCTASDPQRLHFSTIAKLAGIATLHVYLDSVAPRPFYDGMLRSMDTNASAKGLPAQESADLLRQARQRLCQALDLITNVEAYSPLTSDIAFYLAFVQIFESSSGDQCLDINALIASLSIQGEMEKLTGELPVLGETFESLSNWVNTLVDGFAQAIVQETSPFLPDPGEKGQAADPGVADTERAHDRVHMLAHLASFIHKIQLELRTTVPSQVQI